MIGVRCHPNGCLNPSLRREVTGIVFANTNWARSEVDRGLDAAAPNIQQGKFGCMMIRAALFEGVRARQRQAPQVGDTEGELRAMSLARDMSGLRGYGPGASSPGRGKSSRAPEVGIISGETI